MGQMIKPLIRLNLSISTFLRGLVRKSLAEYLSLPPSLSVCLSLSLTVSLSLPDCLSLSLAVCLSVSLSLPLGLSPCLSPLLPLCLLFGGMRCLVRSMVVSCVMLKDSL